MKNKSNSNTLGISGAYVTNWPEAPKIGDVEPATIVTRLARGSEAEKSLLHCAMNDYSEIAYIKAWFETDGFGPLLSRQEYIDIKAEVMEVVEESFK
jgi:hypothetical protein